MKRLALAAVVLVCVGLGAWQYWRTRGAPPPVPGTAEVQPGKSWLEGLYSQDPREVEQASEELQRLGAAALPAIRATLQNPRSEATQLKAALKACGILGKTAAPAVPDVAAVLAEPGLIAEAAIALSHMGPDALPPLRDALGDDDPVVRREATRSIGKLKERAPLPADEVVTLLVGRMADDDEGVRAVAATYLGIIHERPEESVPALTTALGDQDPEVRRASAAALGSFDPAAAAPAVPALRRASTDRNEDVAREAGRALVKLQSK
jgi:HEAT repeat protein